MGEVAGSAAVAEGGGAGGVRGGAEAAAAAAALRDPRLVELLRLLRDEAQTAVLGDSLRWEPRFAERLARQVDLVAEDSATPEVAAAAFWAVRECARRCDVRAEGEVPLRPLLEQDRLHGDAPVPGPLGDSLLMHLLRADRCPVPFEIIDRLLNGGGGGGPLNPCVVNAHGQGALEVFLRSVACGNLFEQYIETAGSQENQMLPRQMYVVFERLLALEYLSAIPPERRAELLRRIKQAKREWRALSKQLGSEECIKRHVDCLEQLNNEPDTPQQRREQRRAARGLRVAMSARAGEENSRCRIVVQLLIRMYEELRQRLVVLGDPLPESPRRRRAPGTPRKAPTGAAGLLQATLQELACNSPCWTGLSFAAAEAAHYLAEGTLLCEMDPDDPDVVGSLVMRKCAYRHFTAGSVALTLAFVALLATLSRTWRHRSSVLVFVLALLFASRNSSQARAHYHSQHAVGRDLFSLHAASAAFDAVVALLSAAYAFAERTPTALLMATVDASRHKNHRL